MSTLTKEEQEHIATRLDCQWACVYLRCDDYLVNASLVRVKNRLEIVVHVNGCIKFEWGIDKTEEALRFWRPVTRKKWPQKFIKRMEKAIGKRRCKAHGYYDKQTSYTPFWLRPKPFIHHLMKHNKNIGVLDYDAYKAAILELQKEQADG